MVTLYIFSSLSKTIPEEYSRMSIFSNNTKTSVFFKYDWVAPGLPKAGTSLDAFDQLILSLCSCWLTWWPTFTLISSNAGLLKFIWRVPLKVEWVFTLSPWIVSDFGMRDLREFVCNSRGWVCTKKLCGLGNLPSDLKIVGYLSNLGSAICILHLSNMSLWLRMERAASFESSVNSVISFNTPSFLGMKAIFGHSREETLDKNINIINLLDKQQEQIARGLLVDFLILYSESSDWKRWFRAASAFHPVMGFFRAKTSPAHS